jgi:hypothetical protein
VGGTRVAKFRLFLLAVGTLSCNSVVHARSLTVSYNVSGSDPAYSDHRVEGELALFNSSLGRLTEVRYFATGYYKVSVKWDVSSYPQAEFLPGSTFEDIIDVSAINSVVWLEPIDEVPETASVVMTLGARFVSTDPKVTLPYSLIWLPSEGLTGTAVNEYTLDESHRILDPSQLKLFSDPGKLLVYGDYYTLDTIDQDTPFTDFMRDNVSVEKMWDVNYGVEYIYAVPEPTSWTMMIFGFGIIGLYSRRVFLAEKN